MRVELTRRVSRDSRRSAPVKADLLPLSRWQVEIRHHRPRLPRPPVRSPPTTSAASVTTALVSSSKFPSTVLKAPSLPSQSPRLPRQPSPLGHSSVLSTNSAAQCLRSS